MSRFAIAFESENVSPTGEVAGAIFDIEKDIEKDRAIAGADIGDITEDETQSRIEEVLSIEALEEEITDELTDSGRVEEVADNLLDLSTIVERIEQPTETDIALIQTAANMAVAGTDVDAQDVLPALEAFTDMKVAAEGIGEKANAAYASLRESAAALSVKVTDYIKKIFGALSYREKRLAELKNRVTALPNDAKGSFVLRTTMWNVGTDLKQILDGKGMVKGFKASVDEYNVLSTAYIKLTTDFKGAVLKLWAPGSKENAVGERDKLVKMWFDDFLGSFIRTKGTKAQSEGSKPGFTTYLTESTLGGGGFKITVPTAKITADTPEAELRSMITGSNFEVYSLHGFKDSMKQGFAGEKVTYTVDKSDMKQLIATGEAQIVNMKKFLDKNYRLAAGWNQAGGGAITVGGSHRRIVAKGRNTQFEAARWTKMFGDVLLGKIEQFLIAGISNAEKTVA